MNKKYYSWQDVEGQCLDLARQINKSGFVPDYIVGLTRGGLVPAVLLSQYLGVRMETLKVSLRDDGQCESNLWMAEDAFGYVPTESRGEAGTVVDPFFRKNILIVDDINDSGATIKWIQDDWRSSCMPSNSVWDHVWGKNVRIAVLTNNSASVASVDYFADEVNKLEKDVWLVYPWEQFWYNNAN